MRSRWRAVKICLVGDFNEPRDMGERNLANYLAKFLEAWINEMKEITLQQFQKSDDIQVFEAIREHARNKKSSAYPWAKRLLEREHHREVFSPSEHADANDIIKVTDIFKRAPEEFPSWSFIMDPADKAREQCTIFLLVGIQTK